MRSDTKRESSSHRTTQRKTNMLVGELTTFKSYRKKNNLLARQMDAKFIVKNEAPKKTVIGDAGDYLVIDENGDPSVIAKDEFEATYQEVE
jgi:hypothetical protein